MWRGAHRRTKQLARSSIKDMARATSRARGRKERIPCPSRSPNENAARCKSPCEVTSYTRT
eukprot:5249231-Pyramimonas_sp.AAC.1